MKKSQLISALVLMFILLLSGCNNAQNMQTTTAEKDDTANQSSLEQQNKQRNQQNEIIFTGKIEAVQTADLVSKVPGKVEKVYVDIGSQVKQDTTLVNLSANNMKAAVKVALAAVEQAEVTLELAEQEYQRGKELFTNEAISEASFQNSYEGPYKKAQVGLKSARAALEKAQIDYDDMFITAPFSGVITAKNINVGEMASPEKPLLTLVNLNKVVIKGTVDEYQINKIKVGQSAEVRIPALPEQTFNGKLTNIAVAADQQSKAYPIKVQIDNQDYLIKPGMFAEVKIKEAN